MDITIPFVTAAFQMLERANLKPHAGPCACPRYTETHNGGDMHCPRRGQPSAFCYNCGGCRYCRLLDESRTDTVVAAIITPNPPPCPLSCDCPDCAAGAFDACISVCHRIVAHFRWWSEGCPE